MRLWRTLWQLVFGTKEDNFRQQESARPVDALPLPPVAAPGAESSIPSQDEMPEDIEPVVAAPQPSTSIRKLTPSQPSPSPRRRQGPKAITIGLDFGTHSTKIILRLRGSDKAKLLRISKPQGGYPSFACPSLVRIVDDRVCFGGRALEVSGGRLYRSLKVQLLPPESDCSSNEIFSSGLTPDLLVAWYLSWALGRVKLAVEKHFKHSDPKLSLNLAAAMNHIENESLKTRYLGIVQAAWESVFGKDASPVQQGMPVKELRTRFVSWMEKEVPGRELRPFEILPETVAPIVSLSLNPRMDPGMYMIVDMGGGTTELSVNHVQEPGANQQVLCYEDQSARFGGDNFEWLEHDCRGGSCLEEKTSKLVRRFMKGFRQAWGIGYHKDGQNPALRGRWRDFHVLLTGGGARRPDIEQAIRSALPWYPYPVGQDRYRVSWHEPTGIDMGSPDDSESTALLAVAHGLSVPRQQWPVFFMPGEVETQEAPEIIEPPPAFWYID